MKTGKFIKIDDYNNIKMGYGTVDFKNLKTVYIKFNCWLLPDNDTEDFKSIISSSRRKIKNIIYENKNQYFKSECIVDLDIKSKGIKKEKKSFMNLEITLFVENYFDIKNKNVKDYIKKLSMEIIDSGLDNKNLFNFYKTKKI